MTNRDLSRRQFFHGALAASMTASGYAQILGANGRIRVGNIGCGRRNLLRELIDLRGPANIEIAAVCDTWRQKREKAAADVKEHTGTEPLQFVNYQDLLARRDIDAVLIGTPDHQHCAMLIAAIQAGKDVYVEKPLAMNMRELIQAYDVVKKSDRVVQMGTQMRSYPQSNGARGLLGAGALGKVLKVEQVRNGYTPYWMTYGGTEYSALEPAEADIDWQGFLMTTTQRRFDAARYQGWYGYREFSLGPHSGLMVHFIDLVHYVNGLQFPSRVVALGGIYRWKNGFDVPDSVEVVLEYPEGFLVRYCTVFGNSAGNYAKWFGTRGTMDGKNLSPRVRWTVSGEGSGEPDRIQAEMQVPEPETTHHMKNFLDCVRTRRQPIAPIEAGYSHSVAVLMADQAMTTGMRTVYDHAKREIRAG